jgi:hypothetical protein
MRNDPSPACALEPGQLAAMRARPLPRRELTQPALIFLGLLRLYVLVAVPIVCYAFVHALMTPQ